VTETPVVIETSVVIETPGVIETPLVTETPVVTAAHTGAAESATHMAAAITETATHVAATTTTAETATHVAATTTTTTAETATHLAATATVSAPTTAATAATSPAPRKRVSGQSSGESGSRSQNDHDITQHCTFSFGHHRVLSTGNIIATVRLDHANPIDDCTRNVKFLSRYANYCMSGRRDCTHKAAAAISNLLATQGNRRTFTT
jgi:hypothetical protein